MQGRRQSQCFWSLFLNFALLEPVTQSVFWILRAPARLRSLSSCRLALGFTARLLTGSHPRVGPEPMTTD